ncbi:unnamed protein product [Mycena citricolor]|uniref:Uncharacterized protein n=1 Tax=Mycena citricolor TaxID=2018698 RepID=A0AAD2HQP2_9AGAR|nr:unnamed protein product [Mycena citricolor]
MTRSIQLPDEIISEIITPALHLDDGAFSSMERYSPFRFEESSSAYLLVCKSWLRVATPLLYHTVVLRSIAQAQSLAITLTSNPDLGRFIKKLRVEGGFGSWMKTVLENSKHLTDIWLIICCLEDCEDVSGLRCGLRYINPVRLILFHCSRAYHGDTATHVSLLGSFKTALKGWKRLVLFMIGVFVVLTDMKFQNILTLDHDAIKPHRQRSTDDEEIFQQLCSVSSLHSVYIFLSGSQVVMSPRLILLGRNQSLRRIRFIRPSHHQHFPLTRSFYAKIETQGMNHLFDPEDFVQATELHSGNPMFVYPTRLSSDPILEDAIWDRVLYFLYDMLPFATALSEPRRKEKRYLNPLLVCKKFARLSLPHLFSRPSLRSKSMTAQFLAGLAAHPSCGQHIVDFTLSDPSHAPSFKKLLSMMPNLISLKGHDSGCKSVPFPGFTSLVQSHGATLIAFQGMPVGKASAPADPKIFASWKLLQSLDWRSQTVFRSPKVPSNGLANLVELSVSAETPTFLKALCAMELPALRILRCSAGTPPGNGLEFIDKHGSKLEYLAASINQLSVHVLRIFTACPAIRQLGVSCDGKNHFWLDWFLKSKGHKYLQRLVIHLPDDYDMKHYEYSSLKVDILIGLAQSKRSGLFPELQEFEHPHIFWPANEDERARFRRDWTSIAGSLSKDDIHLVGTARIRWRPRRAFDWNVSDPSIGPKRKKKA